MIEQQQHRKNATSYKKKNKNPLKGGPGFILTCETGRERKCQQEGLDILKYYVLEREGGLKVERCEDTTRSKKNLSLDDEIKELKKEDKKKGTFALYDTGARGVVTFLCTLPNSLIVQPYTNNTITTELVENEKQKPKIDNNKIQCNNPKVKRQKTEENGKENSLLKPNPIWDPIKTAYHIMKDLREGVVSAPSSRFVTRMIPIQVSCTTNKEEVRYAAKALFAMNNNGSTATFAIRPKRRLCTNLKCMEVIDLVVGLAPGNWKVDLENPKYTLLVELCKTFCGMSMVENLKDFGNFNLVEAREQDEKSSLNKIT